jgi:5-methylcytosine-specific restriction endonuclease McrA
MKFSLEYIRYMNSKEWKERRERALEWAGYRCQICGDKYRLQCHHNDYSRLGHEEDEDLCVLCASCHRFVTWMLRFRRFVKWVKSCIMQLLKSTNK